ncbi:sensor histidine kinase [Schaedlerella arabinosiphila]|uniref:histidine kinase n=1 Tax=Schaedlerella arabinosiphila TaxID=2044587 RepID=A0A426DR22_9FIRM|nr:HAMP domain-containing sensor histidine kinase [Schaedlerella arabinosiphila]MCI9212241.1 HAMP domain-containing histidine kinase [Ruminococcus sp.]RRK35194.1 sensor histidine kinase [Schaedlerella arabinosiphila]
MMVLTACALLLSAVLGWKLYVLKQDIYRFAKRLEESLDDILSGKEPKRDWEDEDSLWGMVCEKLRRVNHVWQRKEEESLSEKNKMKELISDISHQTKTPAANLKLCMEILQDEPMSDRAEEFLKSMESQIGKLDFLIQGMVKISRLETGVIRIRDHETDLRATIGRAVAAVVPRAEQKQIRLYVECDREIRVRHDGKWTEEAIFNLLDNAVKYTERGGSIRIETVVQEIFTQIRIRDTGKGIAPERQAEIFTRFYREPEVHEQEGVGIGLYLARKIVELQKGYIEVKSEVGEGAEFRICLLNERIEIPPRL